MDIETRITRKLCAFFRESSDEEEAILEYGMQLLVEFVFKTAVTFLLALLIGRIRDYLIFLAVFSLLRANAGGKHCMTNLGCTLSMLSITAAALFLPIRNLPLWVYWVAGALCAVVCLLWAPSTSWINPITDRSVRLRRKCLSVTLVLLWSAAVYFPFFSLCKSAVLVTFVSVTFLVVLQELTRGPEPEE